MNAMVDTGHLQQLLERAVPCGPEAAPVPAPARRPARGLLLAAGSAAALAAALAAVLWRPAAHAAAEPAVAAPPAPAASAADAAVLQASGYVVAGRQATVSAEVTGRLAALHVRAGDRVRRGQLLAELDDGALQAQIALAEAELAVQRQGEQELGVQIAQAQAQWERTQSLVQSGFLSPQQAENERYRLTLLASQRGTRQRQVEVAERQWQLQRRLAAQLRVVAPFDGIVTDSAAQVGEIVSPVSAGGFTRSGVFTLVDPAALHVEVKVNEKYIRRVQVGQPVQVSLHADAAVHQAGRVSAVMPAAERETGAVKVRIALADADARLLPNMGVDVAFLPPAVPSSPPKVLP
jgi:RND family efflux transporter MFP subunit